MANSLDYLKMITVYYVAMTHRNSAGEDYVTFVLGPFPSYDEMAREGVPFSEWYRAKYPGDHSRVLEATSYAAHRLPLGRCNSDYGYKPFGDGPSPIPLFEG